MRWGRMATWWPPTPSIPDRTASCTCLKNIFKPFSKSLNISFPRCPGWKGPVQLCNQRDRCSTLSAARLGQGQKFCKMDTCWITKRVFLFSDRHYRTRLIIEYSENGFLLDEGFCVFNHCDRQSRFNHFCIQHKWPQLHNLVRPCQIWPCRQRW